jgi:hypothetical protein
MSHKKHDYSVRMYFELAMLLIYINWRFTLNKNVYGIYHTNIHVYTYISIRIVWSYMILQCISIDQ